ncbi:MAG: SDR family NAD(P)-dependent oxidoreductase [Pseudomonadota bacterium]
MTENNKTPEQQQTPVTEESAERRRFLRAATVGAAAAAAATALPAGAEGSAQTESTDRRVDVAPVYFPRRRFRPQVELFGKLAVVTGASRGIGRATAEALIAKGVSVIGTSRDPASVANPPGFPLLPLDVSDPTSYQPFIGALVQQPAFLARGSIDILINNAGRFIFGQIVPLPPTDFVADYITNRELGVRTVYSGQVYLTTALLPLMSPSAYSRILFNCSIASYYNGSTVFGQSGLDTYFSAKAALRIYANNLDTTLRGSGSPIKVSTVNPYSINTALAEGLNPVYTQPVNAQGLSDTDPILNAGLAEIRAALANGLPPSLVAEAFVQLAEMEEPLQNVVAAGRRGTLAAQGSNELIEAQLLSENAVSAVPFVVRPRRRR